jgi:hypothetical protein
MYIRVEVSGLTDLEGKSMDKAVEIIEGLDWKEILKDAAEISPLKESIQNVHAYRGDIPQPRKPL